MIFICLGSQIFQMDRLLIEVDRLIEKGIIKDEVFAQIGSSTYKPKHFAYVDFMGPDQYEEKVRSADLILSHGGTGALIKALKNGKQTIGIARLQKYGEAENDHQLQILEFLSRGGYLIAITEVDELEGALKELARNPIRKQFHGEGNIPAIIDRFISDNEARRTRKR